MVRWVLFVSFAAALTAAQSQPKLDIQPNTGTVTKEVGASLALTCKPNVQDLRLIDQLEWRDSKNIKIENTNRENPISVQKLPDDTGLVLFFQKLSENNGGNYTCTANYASEQLRSTVIVRTFVDITFVDAPESQFPKVGEDYLVKCKVLGNPTPIVDWNKEGEIIVTRDRYVIRSDGLLIKNVRESDDGEYRCTAVVLNTGQFKSRNIKVEVIIPPVIQEMKEISVIEGETAWTKCVATGKPRPEYTWIKKGTSQDLSKTDRFDVKKNTGELVINRVEFYDDGIYTCAAENRAGTVEKTVKINVQVKPNIFELLNVTSPIKSETKLICKVRGRPPPIVTFRKLSNKEPFQLGQQKDNRIVLEVENFESKAETYGTLIISNLNRSDDGLYQCIAENQAGLALKNGHITVEFPPTFERTKEFHQIAWTWPDHPGNLTCIPEAIPNATVVWKHNGIIITPDMHIFKQEGNGPTSNLIVNNWNDNRFFGKYECLAVNKLGSRSIWLELREAKIPENVQQITAEAITATSIKWKIVPPRYFTSLPIRTFTVRYRVEQDRTWDFARNHTWSFNAPLILENLRPETTYHFQFAAANDVGIGPWTNSPSFAMPRRSEPSEPRFFIPTHHLTDENDSGGQGGSAVVSPYSDHFELRWQVPNNNGDPIDSYLIRYCVIQKINGEWRDGECSEQISQSVQYTSYELKGLKPDTMYKVELRAHNSIGASSPGQMKVKTPRGQDPTVPYSEPPVTNFAIIGLVVGAVILLVILVDLICFCVNRMGILAFICNRHRSKQNEEDPKLSREDEREPLKGDNQMNGERNMSVEFDGKHVYSKSGEIIGKHSVV